MTWTYDGTPGTNTAAERRDSVRFFIGDTDTNDQQVTDEEITFALSQAGNDVYTAAAITARALAGKYSRLVDTSVESVRSSYSQRAVQYNALAVRMEKQSKMFGAGGLGSPSVGGVSKSAMESAREDTDRVDPAFKRGQFANPPLGISDDDYGDFD